MIYITTKTILTLLNPFIFNVMVGVIISIWAGLVAENKARPDGFGYKVAEKAEFFYAYSGLVNSTNLVWFQW